MLAAPLTPREIAREVVELGETSPPTESPHRNEGCNP